MLSPVRLADPAPPRLSPAPFLYATTGTTTRQAFYLGLGHGMAAYGATLHWLTHIFGKAAIPLFAIMALFTAGFCGLNNVLEKRARSTTAKILIAAGLWTAFEFYRSELFFLRFPWITPGTGLGPTFLSPLVGVYGASFLVVAAGAAALYRKSLPAAVLLNAGVAGLLLARPPAVAPPRNRGFTVAVVQDEDCNLDTHIALSQSLRKVKPALIVWPEYAVPYDLRKHKSDLARLQQFCAGMQAVLVLGAKTEIGPGPKDWYNTALVLDGRGPIGEYHKARPVHFFNDGIPGDALRPLHTPLGTMGIAICFDCDYSAVPRQIAARGAEFFIAPSFDAESWSAAEHFQHALLFRIRAAETGRWFACAASSGVSQIIDPHGRVHARLAPMKTGAVAAQIGCIRKPTFYVRFGWLFPWICLTVAGLLVLRTGAERLLKRRKPVSSSAAGRPANSAGADQG